MTTPRVACLTAVCAIGLTACGDLTLVSSAPPEASAPVPGAAARAIILPVVQNQAPGPAAEILTDCIVENASAAELVTIAGANAGAVPPDTIVLISEILSRPETVACASSSLA